MNKDEARQKWCPFVRVTVREDGAYIERPDGLSTLKCIASDCMAWRKYTNLRPNEDRTGTIQEVFGYCGLAGKP